MCRKSTNPVHLYREAGISASKTGGIAVQIYDFPLPPLDERMYVVLEEREALVIDPSVNQAAVDLMEEHKIEKAVILLTHEHFDHITGVDFFRNLFGAKTLCSGECAVGIQDTRKNLSARYEIFYLMNPSHNREEYAKMCAAPFVCAADETFENYKLLQWCGHSVELISTPGHSPGSSCILIDKKHLFSGDSLVNGFEVITRYPGGSRKRYEECAMPFFRRLGGDTIVYPGHGNRAPIRQWSI